MHVVMPPSQSIPAPVFTAAVPSRHFQTLRQSVGTNTSCRHTIYMAEIASCPPILNLNPTSSDLSKVHFANRLLTNFCNNPVFILGSQQLIKPHGGCFLEAGGHMGIGVQGDGYGGMAQTLLDYLGMNPQLQPE